MQNLKDLDVEWVSLVGRAAVRDPDDPDEPQRFLLTKRDQQIDERQDDVSTMTPQHTKALDALALSPGAVEALHNAMEELEPYADEAGISALIGKLRGGTPDKSAPEPETGAVEKLAKALEDLKSTERELLHKSDGKLPQAVRAQLAKSSRALQVEYLHAVGANVGVWEEARALQEARARAGL